MQGDTGSLAADGAPPEGVTDLVLYERQVSSGTVCTHRTNITGSGVELARRLLAVSGDADLSADDVAGEVLQVRWWYAHPVEITDDHGECLPPAVRVVLIDERNRTISFVSGGILRSLSVLVGVFGDGEWSPPLPLIVRACKTRRGFRVYNLQVAPDPLLPAEPVKESKRVASVSG